MLTLIVCPGKNWRNSGGGGCVMDGELKLKVLPNHGWFEAVELPKSNSDGVLCEAEWKSHDRGDFLAVYGGEVIYDIMTSSSQACDMGVLITKQEVDDSRIQILCYTILDGDIKKDNHWDDLMNKVARLIEKTINDDLFHND